MAAILRRDLQVEVQLTEGLYGEFTVLVDDEKVIDGGALGFLGVLPSAGRVRSLVARKPDGSAAPPHGA